MTSRLPLLVAACLALPATAHASEYVVDRDDDADVSTCTAAADDCTLRGAINASNGDANPDDNVIRIDGRHVRLTEGLPVVTAAVSIAGDGPPRAVVDGAGTTAYILDAEAPIDLRDLEITGAKAPAGEFGLAAGLYKGATLTGVAVVDNETTGLGFGGDVTVSDSVIARNTGTQVGGLVVSNAFVTLRDTTVAGNTALPVPADQMFKFTTGGIFNQGGFLTLDHVTLADNRIPPDDLPIGYSNLFGNDIYHAMVRMRSSIVAGDGPVCGALVRSFGHNVVSDGSCHLEGEGDREGADPKLGPFDADGHRPLLEGSPAVDIGGPCPAPQGRACDAGALESPFTAPVPVEPTATPTAAPPAATPSAAPPSDTTAPGLTIAPLREVTRKRLRRGLAVTVTASEPVIGHADLLVRGEPRASASSFARATAQRFVLRARGRVRRATVRVTVFDAAANATTKTLRLKVSS